MNPLHSGFVSQFTEAEQRWFGVDNSMAPRAVAAESTAARLAAVAGLRPLPDVGKAAMALLAAPSLGRASVHPLVARDVALAAKVVRFAATARAIPGEPIQSVGQALARVGRRMLPGLVASAVTEAPLADPTGAARAVSVHSLGTAVAVRILGEHYALRDLEELYLCGLFHDLGRLLRIQAGEPDSDDPEAEYERFGYDHAALAAEVLRQWHLPERTVRVVGLHHLPGRAYASDTDVAVRAALLHIADGLEPLLARGATLGEAVPVVCDAVAEYYEFTSDDLQFLWPRLLAAHAEALAGYPS